MGKAWKKGLRYIPRNLTKKNPVDPDYNLEKFGCVPISRNNNSQILEMFLQRGIPCQKHNAYYLKEWKLAEITDAFN